MIVYISCNFKILQIDIENKIIEGYKEYENKSIASFKEKFLGKDLLNYDFKKINVLPEPNRFSIAFKSGILKLQNKIRVLDEKNK